MSWRPMEVRRVSVFPADLVDFKCLAQWRAGANGAGQCRNTFQPSRDSELAGTAGAGAMASSTSTRISARLKCAGTQFTREYWYCVGLGLGFHNLSAVCANRTRSSFLACFRRKSNIRGLHPWRDSVMRAGAARQRRRPQHSGPDLGWQKQNF